MALLEVQDLCVCFPTAEGPAHAVSGVSFTLEAGRTLCLVGESGCGKSTVARSLLRLQPATAQVSGSIRFDGVSLFDLAPDALRAVRGGGIALIFQEAAASFNPLYTIGSHVAETVRLHRPLSRRAAWNAALELLREVHLPERAARQYVHELSGGMLQRALLAVALAGHPRVLVADEPTSALDATVQAEILDLIDRTRTRHGMTLLWITHDLEVVTRLADMVAVMYCGKIVEEGPVREVFACPLHPYTAGLLNCRPRPGQSGRLRSIEGTVPALTRLPAGCRFRERCPLRSERCLQEPPLEEHAVGRRSACWHWELAVASRQ